MGLEKTPVVERAVPRMKGYGKTKILCRFVKREKVGIKYQTLTFERPEKK